MSKSDPDMGINSWLEDELYQQYLHDRSTVDESWKHVFEEPRAPHSNGGTVAPQPGRARRAAPPRLRNPPRRNCRPLRGAAGRIAENMDGSLSIPLATSQRTIAVKVMDENRRIINQHRTLLGKSKVSYTHIIGWAIVKALEDVPGAQPRLRRKGRPALPRRAHGRSTSASPSTWPARTARAT